MAARWLRRVAAARGRAPCSIYGESSPGPRATGPAASAPSRPGHSLATRLPAMTHPSAAPPMSTAGTGQAPAMAGGRVAGRNCAWPTWSVGGHTDGPRNQGVHARGPQATVQLGPRSSRIPAWPLGPHPAPPLTSDKGHPKLCVPWFPALQSAVPGHATPRGSGDACRAGNRVQA